MKAENGNYEVPYRFSQNVVLFLGYKGSQASSKVFNLQLWSRYSLRGKKILGGKKILFLWSNVSTNYQRLISDYTPVRRRNLTLTLKPEFGLSFKIHSCFSLWGFHTIVTHGSWRHVKSRKKICFSQVVRFDVRISNM